LYCRAKFDAWNDQLRLVTIAAWNGQLFHGRLMSKQGLSSAAIEEVLPRPRMTAAEKRAARTADLARKVAAVNAVMRPREASGKR
jgi:hypothetical protein